jgi:hypothetical protein
VASAALFVLGVYLSIRVLAALYRIADLRYRMGTDWPRVAAGIAAWGGSALLVALAAGPRRTAFVSGFAAYGVLHALLHLATRAYVGRRVARQRRAFDDEN